MHLRKRARNFKCRTKTDSKCVLEQYLSIFLAERRHIGDRQLFSFPRKTSIYRTQENFCSLGGLKMQELDFVRIHFNESNLAFLNLLLGLIMYGIALELRFEDFKLLVDKPRSSITGIISQFVLFPFATYLLLWILKPSPGIALGMLLVAACPGGNISNFITLLAKGNTALSISLTAFSSALAIFITPLIFLLGKFISSRTNDVKNNIPKSLGRIQSNLNDFSNPDLTGSFDKKISTKNNRKNRKTDQNIFSYYLCCIFINCTFCKLSNIFERNS
ncbi:sodium Bile acid symporter domain protein [Leptospira noguchii str. 2007001578]|uniref:Sodium Bile acid symporter domain protein n=1 Tax=Leptospira noguchii str. 2007001578 TaxID=1049974 RepID=A0ABN0J413_9LEPT|nr:sodium Bile acid symporter domain protein [Leptospira noguchii str. 2007001578]